MHSPALSIDFSPRSTLAFAPVQSRLLGALRAAASQLRRMAYLSNRVNPALPQACGLFFSLCPLFDARVVCFQWFADSFRKTPGVGVSLGLCVIHPQRKLLALCFHGLTNCFSRKPFVFITI